jgi:hypothetical protein
MVTATILIADEDLSKRVAEDAIFNDWAFSGTGWGPAIEISVPDLSPKERHLIEGLISSEMSDSATIHSRMPFRFDKREAVSLELLRSYLQHYRRYPTFARTL